MLRSIVLFLAVLLAVQFTWAGAAAYCQHETDASAVPHFGHHEHVHKDVGKKSTDSKLVADPDCNVCHASCAHPLRSEVAATLVENVDATPLPPTAAQASSPPPSSPYRPKWSRLT
ncbi:cation efflux protein, CzcI family [Variovorax sp. GT1P44]|uniref:cation efflux protein, CzcI family n=1 Tax=Variovorax sp. GT1P44 TaxID=3443742 RepID=UPI003F458561